jgi:hypothetical protein
MNFLLIALLLCSFAVFVFGLLGEREANKYILRLSIIEGKPSVTRRKAAIKIILAYLLLFAAFAVCYFIK